MSKRSLLDIDESIITKNLLLPGNQEEDDFGALLKSFNKNEQPSITIKPTPGACVKVKTECGQKVFLNICQTTEIPAPVSISDDKLLQMMNDEEVSSYRIPMSIGQERMEADNSGEPRSTFDIAINTTFFKQCQENKLLWTFMISVVIEGVSDKYEKRISASEGCVVLKNRKAMGKLQEHRIQKRDVVSATRTPLVEELDGTNLPSTKLETETIEMSQNISNIDNCSNAKQICTQPEYRIMREPKEGNVEKLIGQFKLKNLLSAKDLLVDIGEDRIIVEVHRTGYLIDIFVPYSIEQENVSAVLNLNDNMLTIDMPVIQC